LEFLAVTEMRNIYSFIVTFILYANVHSENLKLLNAISCVSMMSSRKILRQVEVLDIVIDSDRCLN
jgi:hypothetical protein